MRTVEICRAGGKWSLLQGFWQSACPRRSLGRGSEFPERQELATVRVGNSFRTDFATGLPKRFLIGVGNRL